MNVTDYKTQQLADLIAQRREVEQAREKGKELAVALKVLDSPYVTTAHEFVTEQNEKIDKLIAEITILGG